MPNIIESLFVLTLVSVLMLVLNYCAKIISIAAAYKAKLLCSGVFISHRNPEAVVHEDLEAEDLAYFRLVTPQVDFIKQSASASLFGLSKRTAIYKPDLGCVLVYGDKPINDASLQPIPHESGFNTSQLNSHDSHHTMDVTTQNHLDSVLDWAFAEPDSKHKRRTRAVVILLDGKIVAERYAPGFDQNMPLPGWSMAKSVINALVGVLVGQGKLDLDAPAPVPIWQGIDDPRREITLNYLMLMTSGLEFIEKSNNPLYDLTKMLLTTPNAYAYAASKTLRAKPGSHWHYASGNTNIISRIIRDTLGEEGYRRFPLEALFEPVGMENAKFEADASGTFVGSSFLYATARDWAKFGQLYLQDGVWEGNRILPEGWVSYSTTPTLESNGRYGAHFWLECEPKKVRDGTERPLPPGAFHAMGYEGQCVSMLPSHQLVVVRLGLTRKTDVWRQDKFLNRILDAIAVS